MISGRRAPGSWGRKHFLGDVAEEDRRELPAPVRSHADDVAALLARCIDDAPEWIQRGRHHHFRGNAGGGRGFANLLDVLRPPVAQLFLDGLDIDRASTLADRVIDPLDGFDCVVADDARAEGLGQCHAGLDALAGDGRAVGWNQDAFEHDEVSLSVTAAW